MEYVTWTTLYEFEVRRQDDAIARVIAPNIEQVWESLDWNSSLCTFRIIKDMPGFILSKSEPKNDWIIHEHI